MDTDTPPLAAHLVPAAMEGYSCEPPRQFAQYSHLFGLTSETARGLERPSHIYRTTI